MVKNKDKWSALSMSERADLIKLYVSNGITSLDAIKKDYNSFAPGGPIEVDEYGYPADITPSIIKADYPRENEVWKRADASNADMVRRLKQGSSRVTIQDWEDPKKVATHKMMSAGNYVVGNVQSINGQLFDFTDPKHGFENPDRAAIDSAIERGDYIKFDTEGDARYFAEHYKKHYNSFAGGGNTGGGYLDPDEARLKNATQKTIEYAKSSYRDPDRQDLGFNTMYSFLQDNYRDPLLDHPHYAGKIENNLFRYFDTNNDGEHDYRDDKIVKMPSLVPVKAPTDRRYMGEFIELPGSAGIRVHNPFYDPRLVDKTKTLLTHFQSDENLERLTAEYADLRYGVAGQYSSENPMIQINQDYKNEVENTTTHEGMHFYTTISPDNTKVKAGYASKYFIPYANSSEFKAKYRDFYWDDPSEVYARVKTFMEANNINNNKPFTQEDYDKLKENYNYVGGGDELINRYDAETFINLINSVYANGGKLNKFATGGTTNTTEPPTEYTPATATGWVAK